MTALEHLWPPGSPRILVTDAWLANAGDAAVALALDRMLKAVAPGASIVHASYLWDIIGPRVPQLTFVPPLEHLFGSRSAPPAAAWKGRGQAVVDEADFIVCQGAFLVAAHESDARLAALSEVLRQDKRLAIVGLALGELGDAAARAEVSEVLRGADLIVARDSVSHARALEYGAANPVLGSDLAITLYPESPLRRSGLGISVVLSDYDPDSSVRSARAAVAADLLETVARAAEGEPITVWSTVQGASESADEDDSQLAEAVLASLPPYLRRGIDLDRGVITARRARELVRSSRALVTMRLHPAIFAAGSGTPFALILEGERSAVLADTALEASIAAPGDRSAIELALRAALESRADNEAQWLWDALEPLRRRLDDTRDRLVEFLAQGPRGSARTRRSWRRAARLSARGAASVAFAARMLRSAAPRPAAGAVQGWPTTAAGLRLAWGWVEGHPEDLAAVVVTLDGRPVTTARLGPPPPDVLAAFPDRANVSTTGWSAKLRIPQAAERIVIGAVALTRRGRAHVLTPLAQTVDGSVVGELALPEPGAVVEPGPLLVVGSAAPDAPLARVEVAVDGQPAGRARPFTHDEHDAPPSVPLTGFEHIVMIEPAAETRPVTITAEAVTLDGARHHVGTVTVEVERAEFAATSSMDDSANPMRDPARTRPRKNGPRRPRIAVFTHTLSLGGAQFWLQEVLRCLIVERRAECFVITGREGPLRRQLEDLGASVVVADVVTSPPGAPDAHFVLAELMNSFQPDVALANTTISTMGVEVAERSATPVVWAIHEHVSPHTVWGATPGTRGQAKRFAGLFRRAHTLVFVCDATRRIYADTLGESANQQVVRYGIDVAAVDDERRTRGAARDVTRHAAGIPPEATLLLSLGTIEPRKGPALLVNAIAALRAEHPDLHVAFVGNPDRGYGDAIHRLVQHLGVTSRVHLLPATRQPLDWLAAADAFVMSSDLESMPRAAMEAMACRLPTVLGDVAGCAELLDNGHAGFLVPPRDVQALISSLQKLLAMPIDARQTLAEAGRAVIVERHGDLGYTRVVADLLERAAE